MQRLTCTLRFAAFLLALAHAIAWAAPASAAGQYSNLFAFGDSTADVGNVFIATQQLGIVPAIPPSITPNATYFQGRFSNGPVFVEYLWGLLSGSPPGAPGPVSPSLAVGALAPGQAVSFAFGGSGTGITSVTPTGFQVPGLLNQVGTFRLLRPNRALAASALYVISSASNDYLFAPRNAPVAPPLSVARISAAIGQLYEMGGRTFVVLNVPDLGRLPLTWNSPDWRRLSAMSERHNEMLARALPALAARLPGARIVVADLQAAAQHLPPGMELTIPALDTFPGFAPTTSVCLFVHPATCPDAPAFNIDPRYFYWDAEHPTTAVHQLLAGFLYALVP
jgi:outer membrane lipase/esterase